MKQSRLDGLIYDSRHISSARQISIVNVACVVADVASRSSLRSLGGELVRAEVTGRISGGRLVIQMTRLARQNLPGIPGYC